jgi:class 3 adenylate cyclase
MRLSAKPPEPPEFPGVADGHRRLSKMALSITRERGMLSVRFDIERHSTTRDQRSIGEDGLTSGRPGSPQPEITAFTQSNLHYDAQAPYSYPSLRPVSLGKNSAVNNFWDALDATQQQDFIALAEERVFAAQAKLMREGEHANHVAVISSGRVRIYVEEEGRERTLAVRGHGELIGERAALEVSVRSATVMALETVHALVVKTEDFAAFVSDRPGVLRIVESQIYGRLTEEVVSSAPHAGQSFRGQNCTIVITDVANFAADDRDDLDRLAIRAATADITKLALEPFWQDCGWADRGDGLLIVVPPDIPTATILERLMAVLPRELEQFSMVHDAATPVQLRIAVNVGPVVTDDMGMSGMAIIRAARMLESQAFKDAIADAGSQIGVVASEFVYDMAIRHAGKTLDPASYVQIQVDVKEYQGPAWMHLVNRA